MKYFTCTNQHYGYHALIETMMHYCVIISLGWVNVIWPSPSSTHTTRVSQQQMQTWFYLISEVLNDAFRWCSFINNTVHRCHQWKSMHKSWATQVKWLLSAMHLLFCHVACDQEPMYFKCRGSTLQLLTIKKLFFNFFNRLYMTGYQRMMHTMILNRIIPYPSE